MSRRWRGSPNNATDRKGVSEGCLRTHNFERAVFVWVGSSSRVVTVSRFTYALRYTGVWGVGLFSEDLVKSHTSVSFLFERVVSEIIDLGRAIIISPRLFRTFRSSCANEATRVLSLSVRRILIVRFLQIPAAIPNPGLTLPRLWTILKPVPPLEATRRYRK